MRTLDFLVAFVSQNSSYSEHFVWVFPNPLTPIISSESPHLLLWSGQEHVQPVTECADPGPCGFLNPRDTD